MINLNPNKQTYTNNNFSTDDEDILEIQNGHELKEIKERELKEEKDQRITYASQSIFSGLCCSNSCSRKVIYDKFSTRKTRQAFLDPSYEKLALAAAEGNIFRLGDLRANPNESPQLSLLPKDFRSAWSLEYTIPHTLLVDMLTAIELGNTFFTYRDTLPGYSIAEGRVDISITGTLQKQIHLTFTLTSNEKTAIFKGVYTIPVWGDNLKEICNRLAEKDDIEIGFLTCKSLLVKQIVENLPIITGPAWGVIQINENPHIKVNKVSTDLFGVRMDKCPEDWIHKKLWNTTWLPLIRQYLLTPSGKGAETIADQLVSLGAKSISCYDSKIIISNTTNGSPSKNTTITFEMSHSTYRAAMRQFDAQLRSLFYTPSFKKLAKRNYNVQLWNLPIIPPGTLLCDIPTALSQPFTSINYNVACIINKSLLRNPYVPQFFVEMAIRDQDFSHRIKIPAEFGIKTIILRIGKNARHLNLPNNLRLNQKKEFWLLVAAKAIELLNEERGVAKEDKDIAAHILSTIRLCSHFKVSDLDFLSYYKIKKLPEISEQFDNIIQFEGRACGIKKSVLEIIKSFASIDAVLLSKQLAYYQTIFRALLRKEPCNPDEIFSFIAAFTLVQKWEQFFNRDFPFLEKLILIEFCASKKPHFDLVYNLILKQRELHVKATRQHIWGSVQSEDINKTVVEAFLPFYFTFVEYLTTAYSHNSEAIRNSILLAEFLKESLSLFNTQFIIDGLKLIKADPSDKKSMENALAATSPDSIENRWARSHYLKRNARFKDLAYDEFSWEVKHRYTSNKFIDEACWIFKAALSTPEGQRRCVISNLSLKFPFPLSEVKLAKLSDYIYQFAKSKNRPSLRGQNYFPELLDVEFSELENRIHKWYCSLMEDVNIALLDLMNSPQRPSGWLYFHRLDNIPLEKLLCLRTVRNTLTVAAQENIFMLPNGELSLLPPQLSGMFSAGSRKLECFTSAHNESQLFNIATKLQEKIQKMDEGSLRAIIERDSFHVAILDSNGISKTLTFSIEAFYDPTMQSSVLNLIYRCEVESIMREREYLMIDKNIDLTELALLLKYDLLLLKSDIYQKIISS